VWEGATPGALFSDPVTALRNWISAIAVDVSKEGVPFLMPALGWLNALLGDALPSDTMSKPPTFDLPLTGSGTYDDPWALPMIAGAPPSAEALVWLDSAAGMTTPPAAWASALLARAGTVTDLPSLLSAANGLAAFYPGLGSALKGLDPDRLATALSALETFLTQSDGVVPSNSAGTERRKLDRACGRRAGGYFGASFAAPGSSGDYADSFADRCLGWGSRGRAHGFCC